MVEQIKGVRWIDGMAVHGDDLQRESQAWQSSLLDRFMTISDYGIVNPDTDFLVAVRGSSDPMEMYLTPGTCYPPSGEKISILAPSTPGATSGVSFWLKPPATASLASNPHLLDPTTGDSLLLGDPLQTNLVWVIYVPRTTRPTILENLVASDAEWEESFVIMVSPFDAPRADVPAFFWDNIDRAVLVGVISPTSTTAISSTDIDLTQDIVTYNRPMFSGRDDYARKKIQDFRLLLDTYPNAYVERRSSAVGNVYGDVFTETYVYSDVYQDDLSGKYTNMPGAFYLKTTHFPKFIVSAVHSNGLDMSEVLQIVARKKYLTLDLSGNQVTPIAQGETLTIVYSYYNVAEGYLNKSTNPDSVAVAQPLTNEMVLVQGAAYTAFNGDIRIPSDKAQYPSTYTFFMGADATLDCKPRVVFGATDLRRYQNDTTLTLAYQITSPSMVRCFLTGPAGVTPGIAGVQFYLTGTDGNGDIISDTVTVTSTSATESKPGLGNNGSDWLGFYSTSTKVFSTLTGCTLTDNDAEAGVASNGSNKDFTAFVLSTEDIDLRQDLPNCKVSINAAGDAQEWTFEDLRDDYLFQNLLSLISSCKQVTLINGVIMAWLPAGEPIAKFDIVSLKPGQAGTNPPQSTSTGYLYKSVASTDTYRPNVIGVAQSALATGAYGWVLLRGVVTNGSWSYLPGVLYLSSTEPGKFSQGYPFQYASSNQDQMPITFSNGGLSPYVHIQVGDGHFYSPSVPAGAPAGYSFVWDVDTTVTAQNFAQVVSAWSAAGSGGTGATLQANIDGSTVTIVAQSGLQNIPVKITQVGSPDTAESVVTQSSTKAALTVGLLESGGTCVPAAGDGFTLNGTTLHYGTDWTSVNDLAAVINSSFGGGIVAVSAGTTTVNLTSAQPFTLTSAQAATPAYGSSCIAITGQTYQYVSGLTVAPELMVYKPTIRCGYAITSTKVLFDGPVFSKKYASELYVEDMLKQYSSNQAEGCLVEVPKFIVLCRRPEIIPLAGAAPIFVDDDSSDGINRMFVWVQGFTGSTAVICIAIKRASVDTSTPELRWYMTPDDTGAITVRVLPDCSGEIAGVKNQCYPDKLGKQIGDTANQSGGGHMNLKRETPDGHMTLNPSDLVKNPFAQSAPPDESYPSEASGTYYDDPTYDTFDYQGTLGGDALEFIDAKTVQIGFRDSTAGDGCRLYVSGFDRMSLVEIAIGTKAKDARVKFFTLGWERINFFGMEGDKVRFYLTPRCSEPRIYESGLGGSDSGLAPAANNPRTCKVLGASSLPRVCTKWE